MMLSFKEFVKIRDYIYRKTGIFIDDNKKDNFIKKLKPYFENNDFNFRSFFHNLRFSNDKNLLQELINLITVNETYFYREKHHFNVLMQDVLPRLHEKKPLNETLRILCAPSSSGEEPYTIALTLLEEETILNKRDLEIVAIDIDSMMIDKAIKGIFTKRSVQFIPQNLLEQYFEWNENECYIIDSKIRDAINFQTINIMDKQDTTKLGKFDVIFSRNMLIYFDDESRQEAGITFYSLLNDDGYLFLGHADKMSKISSLFNTCKIGKSLIYQKAIDI
jgi:chemotaxis protein methyltransferase CheR